jgi:hypothetical protein
VPLMFVMVRLPVLMAGPIVLFLITVVFLLPRHWPLPFLLFDVYSPPAAASRGPTLSRLADELVGDVLCPSLQPGHDVLASHEHPVVEPHVSHFMQVPFRTSEKCPHSPHISPS